jgi:PHD/YefM family antitoxin component YafN of YafNO toxin-antitoxin module
MKSVALADVKTKLPSLVEEVRLSGEPIEIREQDEAAVYLVEAEAFRRFQETEDTVRTERLRRALEGEKYALEEVLAELHLDL